jgi:hypothetical protein
MYFPESLRNFFASHCIFPGSLIPDLPISLIDLSKKDNKKTIKSQNYTIGNLNDVANVEKEIQNV